MPYKSLFPDLNLQKSNVLTYLFPPKFVPSSEPIWVEAAEPSLSISQRTLLYWVKKLAVGFKSKGLKRGNTVMIFTPNHIFVPVVYLGIVGSGLIFSAANPDYTINELHFQLGDTRAGIVFVHPDLVDKALAAAELAGLPRNRVFLFSEQKNAPVNGVQDWHSMLGSDKQSEKWHWEPLNGEEASSTVATLNFSSGTTGLPKGVSISHHNLISSAEQMIYTTRGRIPARTQIPERWIGFLPLYHAYGQTYTILMACKLQIPVYVMKSFNFRTFLRHIQDYRITDLQVVPPILILLNKRPETKEYDLSSLVKMACGAAPVSQQLQNDVATQLGVSIHIGYGMTELTCGAFTSALQGKLQVDGGIGLLYPNMECKLLDDEGNEVGPGERGEICLRGPNVCLRYWKNEKATEELFDEEGWLRTGDVAIRNEKGWHWLVDRKKELIKVNGLQVAPAELEATLLEHDAIADAAVVGVLLNGKEVPRAYVVLKDQAKNKHTESSIQEWIVPKVAKHKRLKGGVVFVEQVPKSTSGKIVRKMVKEWAKKDAVVINGRAKAVL